jgi:hypothetical protein
MAHNHGVLSFFLFDSAICRHSSEQCALKQTRGTKADSKPDHISLLLPFMNINFIWSEIKRFRDYTRDGNVTFRMPCTKSHTAHRICKEHSHDYKAGEHTSSLMLKSMEHACRDRGGRDGRLWRLSATSRSLAFWLYLGQHGSLSSVVVLRCIIVAEHNGVWRDRPA